MKKLLSILGAVGLSTTTIAGSTYAVSCSTFLVSDQIKEIFAYNPIENIKNENQLLMYINYFEEDLKYLEKTSNSIKYLFLYDQHMGNNNAVSYDSKYALEVMGDYITTIDFQLRMAKYINFFNYINDFYKIGEENGLLYKEKVKEQTILDFIEFQDRIFNLTQYMTSAIILISQGEAKSNGINGLKIKFDKELVEIAKKQAESIKIGGYPTNIDKWIEKRNNLIKKWKRMTLSDLLTIKDVPEYLFSKRDGDFKKWYDPNYEDKNIKSTPDSKEGIKEAATSGLSSFSDFNKMISFIFTDFLEIKENEFHIIHNKDMFKTNEKNKTDENKEGICVSKVTQMNSPSEDKLIMHAIIQMDEKNELYRGEFILKIGLEPSNKNASSMNEKYETYLNEMTDFYNKDKDSKISKLTFCGEGDK